MAVWIPTVCPCLTRHRRLRRSIAQVRLEMSFHGHGGEKRILASRQRFHHKEKAGGESMTGADCSSVVFIGTLGLPT
jgi:hypothetical protein